MNNKNISIKLIYGDDNYLIDRRSSFIVSNLCNDISQAEIFSFTASSTNEFVKFVHSILESLNTVSLFSSKKTIWLRNLTCFSDIQYAKTEDSQDALNLLLDSLAVQTNNKIVISLNNPDKRLKIFKILTQISNIEEIKSDNKTSLSNYSILEFCKPHNINFTSNAIELFKQKLGKDSRLSEQEINKLAAYIYPRTTVTLNDVQELVTDNNPGEFFDQLDSFFSGETKKINAMIDQYFWTNNEGRALLYAIQNRTRLLIQLKTLQENKLIALHFSANDLAKIQTGLNITFESKTTFNIFSQNPWYLNSLLDSIKNISLKQLIKFQIACSDAVIALSINYNNQPSVMKNLALKLI